MAVGEKLLFIVGVIWEIARRFWLSVELFFEGLTRITSISPDFFPKSFNKFAGLKQPEPPEKIYPISVASEQGLDAST